MKVISAVGMFTCLILMFVVMLAVIDYGFSWRAIVAEAVLVTIGYICSSIIDKN